MSTPGQVKPAANRSPAGRAREGGVPLWSERTLYRGDSYEFHSWLGGIQPEGYSTGKFLNLGDKFL